MHGARYLAHVPQACRPETACTKTDCCFPRRPSHKPSRVSTLVRLRQGEDSGVSLFSRGGPALADRAALTRSAKTAVVKFVQGVWFVRRPPSNAAASPRNVRALRNRPDPTVRRSDSSRLLWFSRRRGPGDRKGDIAIRPSAHRSALSDPPKSEREEGREARSARLLLCRR
jgi:hypothetical protein